MRIIALLAALLVSACATPLAPALDTQITLIRGVCYFHCPMYQVVITGDGQVTYTGYNFVHVTGEQRAAIPRADVEHLLQLFDRAHFYALKPSYQGNITDMPWVTVRLRNAGREKEVRDYMGQMSGMPHDVTAIEHEIDRVAGTERWVGHVE